MRTLVLVALSASACRDADRPRRAPAAPVTSARLLRYEPGNVPGYDVVVTGGTATGALVPIDIGRTIAVDIVPENDRLLHVVIGDTDPFASFANDGALLLLPELPIEPLAPGQRWKVSHVASVDGLRIDLTHEITYVGDAACPSAAGQCARLEIAAPARNLIVRADPDAWIVTYGFSGTVVISRDRGAIDESRLRVIGSVAIGAANIPITATVVATPVPSTRARASTMPSRLRTAA